MREQARVVIVGAGIVGCSAATHLTKLGWKDIVVFDQGPLFETGGSTSHAPGITFGTNPSRTMNKMAQYTTELLSGLEYDGEQCWFPVGTVEVATSEARMQELWRRYGYNIAYEARCEVLSPAEVQALVPLIDAGAILGGMLRPDDGNTRAWKAAGAMARQAMATGGAEFYGNTTVTDIELNNGRVEAVVTEQGRIRCQRVLLCTNIWGSVLADKVGVTLPMMACAHHYAITEPLPELAGEERWIAQPPVRHQDRSMYFRQWGDAWCTGSYRHEPRIVSPYDVGRDAYHTWREDDFAVAVEDAIELFPALRGREYVRKINGMFVFSVDGYPIMGPSEVPGFWTAIGIWVTHAGGAGKLIAEWMTDGQTEWDVREMDIARFHDFQLTKSYIRTRSTQNYREVYDIIHPMQQMEDPRSLRLAPFHVRLQEQKGHFFASAGWEAAQWYEENGRLLEKYEEQIPERSGWEAMHWSPIQGAEHLAVRENGGLFNISPFTKIRVEGEGALPLLEKLAANRIDRPVGRVVYTSFCDEAGGIRADLTVTRVAEDRFWVLTGAGSGPRDLRWIRDHAAGDGAVSVVDMSSAGAGVGLWGPKARAVLQRVADEDVSNEAWPYFTAGRLTIGNVPAYGLRISYAGELGWEIYCPAEYGLRLWDILWEAGRAEEIIAFGGGAFDSLRLEKGYRLWGTDIHTEYNPYEAGLGWAVQLNKGEFVGREALQAAKGGRGPQRKLCCLTLDRAGDVALGSEPILEGERVLGYVTSANYGYSVGKFIVYGYLPLAYAEPGTQVEVLYLGRRLPATVVEEPLFDPQMKRLKA